MTESPVGWTSVTIAALGGTVGGQDPEQIRISVLVQRDDSVGITEGHEGL